MSCWNLIEVRTPRLIPIADGTTPPIDTQDVDDFIDNLMRDPYYAGNPSFEDHIEWASIGTGLVAVMRSKHYLFPILIMVDSRPPARRRDNETMPAPITVFGLVNRGTFMRSDGRYESDRRETSDGRVFTIKFEATKGTLNIRAPAHERAANEYIRMFDLLSHATAAVNRHNGGTSFLNHTLHERTLRFTHAFFEVSATIAKVDPLTHIVLQPRQTTDAGLSALSPYVIEWLNDAAGRRKPSYPYIH
jgi:hypothetical protein